MANRTSKKALLRMATALGVAGLLNFMILLGASLSLPVAQASTQSSAQQVDATVYGLTAGNSLISFNMLTPGTIIRTSAITTFISRFRQYWCCRSGCSRVWNRSPQSPGERSTRRRLVSLVRPASTHTSDPTFTKWRNAFGSTRSGRTRAPFSP